MKTLEPNTPVPSYELTPFAPQPAYADSGTENYMCEVKDEVEMEYSHSNDSLEGTESMEVADRD